VSWLGVVSGVGWVIYSDSADKKRSTGIDSLRGLICERRPLSSAIKRAQVKGV